MKLSGGRVFFADSKVFTFELQKRKALLRELQKKQENMEKYGLINEFDQAGVSDRLAMLPLKSFENEREQTSYSYGYSERGSRFLLGKIARGDFSQEEIFNYGVSDFENGVSTQFLDDLRKIEQYFKGRAFAMGKAAYDFVVSQGCGIRGL